MKNTRSIVRAPQMVLDFSFQLPTHVSINSRSPALVRAEEDDQVHAPSKRSAGAELGDMVVDDRVLSQGITTWRSLIDFAIRTGHTELYESEDGRQGLRRPGFRYAPISRLPERAPEYVKDVLTGRLASYLEQKKLQLTSARVAADDTFKAQVVLESSTFQISIFEGRKLDSTWSFKLMDLPRTPGLQADDEEAQLAFVAKRIKRIQREGRIAGGDARLISKAVIRAVESILKNIEVSK